MNESCEYFKALISRLADDDLTPEEERTLRAHVRTCEDCTRFGRTMFALSDILREDIVQPPATLTRDVMERVLEDAGRGGAFTRREAVRARPLRRLAVAACLALVVGIGAYAAVTLCQTGTGDVLEAAMEEPAEPAAAAEPAPIPAPMPEEAAPQAAEAAPEVITPSPPDYEAAAKEETAVAADESPDRAAGSLDRGVALAGVYTRDDPTAVPPGREAEFEALITSVPWPDGEPDAAWHVILAAEYRGVIYEFLTDDGGEYLLWQDAAEGVPALSPGSVRELWDVFG